LPTDQPLTSGEVLKLTGLSKKELQALDEMGILQPEARMRQGIRLFDDQTLMRIEEFIFYDALDLPLELTREIMANSSLQRTADVLDAQLIYIYTKLDTLNLRLASIEAAKEIFQTGKSVPWGVLTYMQRKRPGSDLIIWDHVHTSDVNPNTRIQSFTQIWTVFQAWKRLMVMACLFEKAGIQPAEPLAKSLGLERLNWQREVKSTSSDMKDAYEHLETTEPWLQKPPFERVLDWLYKVEIGL
jgi:DNA-binding transcriptional MerR regulator